MPAELLTIPDIVVGSVVGGDLVLRNVVVSTDSKLPAIEDTQKVQGSLDQFVSDLKVPTNLPPDAVVVLIDSKTNSIIKASPAESEDFIAGGAYFIGAFDRATADAVVADMINNPIPSNEYLAGKFFDSAVKLGVTSYVVGVEMFRAMQNSKESWKNFVTLEDRVMTPPSSVLIKPATSRFPLKVTITAHQLDPNLSPESMEEVSGQIGALFPNMDSRGFSIVSSNDREFTMVGTVASASELQGILTRLTGVNDRLATQFPSGIITVIPDTSSVEAPVVYVGDESMIDPCADTRCIRVYKPCLEGYIDADPCCPNTGNCIPDPNYTSVNAPVGELAQQYLDLNQAIAEIEDAGDDIIFGADQQFTQEELVALLNVGDATVETTKIAPQSIATPTLFATRNGGLNLVSVAIYPQGSFSEYGMVGIFDNMPMFRQNSFGYTGYFWIWQPSRETARLGYPDFDGWYRIDAVLPSAGGGAQMSPMPSLKTQQQSVIIPNRDVFKADSEINPRYAQLVQARDELGGRLGVPAGCQPTLPHILPPTQVPAGCFPIPPRDFPPYDPPQTRPPRPPTKLPCGGRKPCVLIGRIEGGKKGTYKPKPRPSNTGGYDDEPKLDHWDAMGNMIDQYGNVM